MPRKTGLEVLQWLKGESNFRNLSTVIFTSSSNEKDVRSAFDNGADCYLQKPTSYSDLLLMVEKLSAALADPSRSPLADLHALAQSVRPV